ncbi:hypothetical protein D3C76_1425210 [compost metagenome]
MFAEKAAQLGDIFLVGPVFSGDHLEIAQLNALGHVPGQGFFNRFRVVFMLDILIQFLPGADPVIILFVSHLACNAVASAQVQIFGRIQGNNLLCLQK